MDALSIDDMRPSARLALNADDQASSSDSSALSIPVPTNASLDHPNGVLFEDG